MNAIAQEKLSQMIHGQAVVCSEDQLDELDKINETGVSIRTALHKSQIGIHDRYVAWMSGRDSTFPPDITIAKAPSHYCGANPGRCCYSKTKREVEVGYNAVTQGQ